VGEEGGEGGWGGGLSVRKTTFDVTAALVSRPSLGPFKVHEKEASPILRRQVSEPFPQSGEGKIPSFDSIGAVFEELKAFGCTAAIGK
jgi:hypothetical protein